jgi:hypothetical protein
MFCVSSHLLYFYIVTEQQPSKRRKVEREVVKYRSEKVGNFLTFPEFPSNLGTRSMLKNHLFLRSCYKEMFDHIKGCLPLGKKKIVAVLGTAGIGKSSFSIMCLDEYFKDPNSLLNNSGDKSFYYQPRISQLWFYEYVGENDGTLSFYVSKLNIQLDSTNSRRYACGSQRGDFDIFLLSPREI